MNNVRFLRGVTLGSDHCLLRAKTVFPFKFRYEQENRTDDHLNALTELKVKDTI